MLDARDPFGDQDALDAARDGLDAARARIDSARRAVGRMLESGGDAGRLLPIADRLDRMAADLAGVAGAVGEPAALAGA